MPLPITTSAFNDLAKRILKDKKRDTDDATWEEVVLAYNDLCDRVVRDLAFIGYPGAIPRVKSTTTLLDKMRRQPNLAVSRINDFGGVRLIVGPLIYTKGQRFTNGLVLPENVKVGPGRKAQMYMVARIERAFTDNPARSTRAPHVDNRCEEGLDSSGYRAVHIIVYPDGVPIEIQVRTPLQDSWAQISEGLGDLWGRGFRYGGLPDNPDEVVPQSPAGKTRAEIIEDLRAIAVTVNRYEALGDRNDNRALGAILRGDRVQRAIAQDQRKEIDALYDEMQGMLKEFGRQLGVGGAQ